MGKTKNWEENLELKIRMPLDLSASYNANLNTKTRENRILKESECKIYLIVTLSVALTFCVLSATIVIVACFKKYQESKAISLAQNLEREEQEQMKRTEVKSVSHQGKILHSQKLVYNSPHFSQFASAGHSNPRPVTVRSVKRRDKAKIEERRLSQGAVISQNSHNANNRSLDDRTDAVMV